MTKRDAKLEIQNSKSENRTWNVCARSLFGFRVSNFGFLILTAAITGCTSFPKAGPTRNEDPLVGATVTPTGATPLALNPAASTAQPAAALPPLTQATPTSNAALAGGVYAPLMGGSDLRIGTTPAGANGNKIQAPHLNPPGVLAVVTADNGSKNNGVVPLDSTGVKPVNPTFSPSVPNVGTMVNAVGGGIDQSLATLATYNPRWTKLENAGPGSWRFSCSVPDRGEPNKFRTLEAESSTASGAIQSVLERLR